MRQGDLKTRLNAYFGLVAVPGPARCFADELSREGFAVGNQVDDELS